MVLVIGVLISSFTSEMSFSILISFLQWFVEGLNTWALRGVCEGAVVEITIVISNTCHCYF